MLGWYLIIRIYNKIRNQPGVRVQAEEDTAIQQDHTQFQIAINAIIQGTEEIKIFNMLDPTADPHKPRRSAIRV